MDSNVALTGSPGSNCPLNKKSRNYKCLQTVYGNFRGLKCYSIVCIKIEVFEETFCETRYHSDSNIKLFVMSFM